MYEIICNKREKGKGVCECEDQHCIQKLLDRASMRRECVALSLLIVARPWFQILS